MKVYIVETYDELLEGPYVEPTCYAHKEDAIRRVESQTYTDEDGTKHWAYWRELKMDYEMGYEDISILLDELGISERTCHVVKNSRKYVLSNGDELFEDGCSVCNGYLSVDDNYCPNCGARVTPKYSEILRSEVGE